MGKNMVKEHTLPLLEQSVLGNESMVNIMVKGQKPCLVDGSMKGNGEKVNLGTSQYTVNPE